MEGESGWLKRKHACPIQGKEQLSIELVQSCDRRDD